MNISIICAGKIKEKYFSAAADEYKKRISRFAKLEIIELPDEKIPDNASAREEELIKEKEGRAMLGKIKPGTFVAAMCIEGREISSTELAAEIAAVSMRTSRIAFIIGGSLGLSDEVKRRADARLSFGPITLPHQLMRVVMLEQLYRAFKINNNESYHK
ncbi:MAG TPA: 23S rRNA (pseudouridine(1915)-N(3))-methyltransferase RlmH [Candidatus Ornithomonoglobus intestinigallinarum]|jgi:23S rRNA (pseudouridine1915-N3)-methyltransferase|uniref:Ribosomal RNA large subunit methyltransferase H n=1 Tax=Candidatus Ornithomonoglobus intestinigallinarum TaxID=2840894 RepID=A0A9D1H2B3_9FIRM|nr:23S rRNA (pseudouridine(1915)-N(3))-methyltransferase RlmH [Candidatus Ornithomonoglobus intestinigallinarum]